MDWNPKKPGETAQYEFSFADIYPDLISSYTLTATAGTVAIASNASDQRHVYAWISGGVAGETATVSCEIVTALGSTYTRTATLRVSTTADSLEPPSTLTKGAIVIRALGKLGVANYIFDTEAEEDISALRQLDSLASDWQRGLLNFGYIQPATRGLSSPEDASGIAAADEDAFISNLAVALSPDYGKTIPGPLAKEAAESRNGLFIRYDRMPEYNLSARTPVGAGYRLSRRTFFPIPSSE